MLEKPNLPDEKLIACLQEAYGLQITQLTFLPLGADVNTAVYRADDGESAYFVKLRRAAFDETSVAIPRILTDLGIHQIIAPIATRSTQLWTNVDGFTVILYPFVEGRDGFEAELSDQQWIELGASLKGVHAAILPPALANKTPHETYSGASRSLVRKYQANVENCAFHEPVASELAELMQAKRAEISHLVMRAEQLAATLQQRHIDYVLCHADIHAGNVLIGEDGTLHIVDWDTAMLAPKERDLMFIGGGVGGYWQSADGEALFYQGYGESEVDALALAYYRFERIVEDIAATCDQLFSTDEGGDDRQEGLQILRYQFLPNNVVEIAYRSDVA